MKNGKIAQCKPFDKTDFKGIRLMSDRGGVVFILGAGFSKGAGAPLMHDFFEKMKRLRRRKILETNPDDYRFLNQTVRNEILASCNIKSNIDIDNVEAVFNAIEISQLTDGLKNSRFSFSGQDATKAAQILKEIIRDTIESSIEYKRHGEQFLLPEEYHHFASLLNTYRLRNEFDISLVSFNYDVVSEYALHSERCGYQYGFEPIKGNFPRVNLFKLHGSFNWGRNDKTGALEVCHVNDRLITEQVKNYERWAGGVEKITLKFSRDALANFGEEVTFPYIIPPSYNKLGSQLELQQVWSQAASALNTAELIFFIGYSLPESDNFFKDFFALSTFGPAEFEDVYVVNPDEKVFDNIKRLLSAKEIERGRAKHIPKTFEEALPEIEKIIHDYSG